MKLCNDRQRVTAANALILVRVFGDSAEFRLNVQRRGDLWDAMHLALVARTGADQTGAVGQGRGVKREASPRPADRFPN